jgi:hypothetical protein
MPTFPLKVMNNTVPLLHLAILRLTLAPIAVNLPVGACSEWGGKLNIKL